MNPSIRGCLLLKSFSMVFVLAVLILLFEAEVALAQQTFYNGTKCLSRYPQPKCPVLGACNDGAQKPCVMWGSGAYNWTAEELHHYDYMNFYPPSVYDDSGMHFGLGSETAYYHHAPPGSRMCHNTDVPGFWWSGQWHKANVTNGTQGDEDCVFRRLSRREIVKCLDGKKVLFAGDSVVRQLFNRLYWYLRGYESVVEHYYHDSSAFTYFHNATDDFSIGGATLDAFAQPLAPTEAFKVGFAWAMDPSVSLVVKASPDVFVLGGLWGPARGDDFGSLTRRTVEQILLHGNMTGKPSRFFWQLPPKRQVHVATEEYAQRVRAMMSKFSNSSSAGNQDLLRVRADVLPVDRMTEDEPYGRNELELKNTNNWGVHYQCMYFPLYPTKDGSIRGFKTPRSLDCRDMMNFNILMVMMNSLCSE